MTKLATAETYDDSGHPTRSRVIEFVGMLAVVGFFIGIYFAWRTQVNGLITQEQFDHIRGGQTLAQVEDILGTPGRPVETHIAGDTKNPALRMDSETKSFVWENRAIRESSVRLRTENWSPAKHSICLRDKTT